MTVIAGIVDSGVVWMGADTASFDGMGIYRFSHKLDRIDIAGSDDSIIVGSCGTAAFQLAIRYHLKPEGTPDPTDPRDRNAWALALAEAITELGKECDGSERELEGGALVAWRSWLWYVANNCALPAPVYTAVGSGAEVALGALEVSGYGAREALRHALEAACRVEQSCRGPVEIMCTDGRS